MSDGFLGTFEMYFSPSFPPGATSAVKLEECKSLSMHSTAPPFIGTRCVKQLFLEINTFNFIFAGQMR